MSGRVIDFPAPTEPPRQLTDEELWRRLGWKRYFRLWRIANICTDCCRPTVIGGDDRGRIPLCNCDRPKVHRLQEVSGP